MLNASVNTFNAAASRTSELSDYRKFAARDLDFCLYGHFASQERVSGAEPLSGGTCAEGGFQFSSGPGQSIKLEIPSDLPEGLKLIGSTLGRTTHYAVLCSKSFFAKGRRFGPFKGRNVQPTKLVPGADYIFMWEIFRDGNLIHYVDGSTEPENWMKFVNSARHDQETNLHVIQDGEQIFYEVCRDILEGEELLVWYGSSYHFHMGVPTGMKLPLGEETQQSKEEETDFSCDRCGKMFNYRYYRDRHLKYTRCVDQGDRKFPCALCDRSFDKRDRLRIHVLHVHEKHRPHQCGVCSKRFSQSSSLNKHMRVHSGERPYKCPFCIKAFTASSILRTHIRQHSGEKPFKCKHCGRAFASHAAHDSHVRRTHTKEKPCVCEHCGKSFAQSYELKFHINMHTGAKPYTCEKCGRAFSSPSSRDRHRANFDCTTRRNRAPKVMRKNSPLIVQPTGQSGAPQFQSLAEINQNA